MTTQLYDLPETFKALTDLEVENVEPLLMEMMAEYPTGDDGAGQLAAWVTADLLKMGRVIKTLEASEDTLRTFAAGLNARLGAITARKDRMKTWMLNLCEQAGIDKVKDPLVSVYTQTNPPSVEIDDEAAVPMKYKRATVTLPYTQALELLPDDVLATATVSVQRQAILQDVKEDGAVPDGVTVVTGRKHVRVR